MALRLAAGNSHELLSTPTHQFGWIDTRVFVKRLKDYVTRPECYDNPDRVLALSRLSLEHRNAALAKLPKSDDEYIEAVRYALGAGDVTIGPTPGYWISAARARSPFTDDEKVRAVHPGYGADAALTALYHVSPDSSVKMLRGSSFVPAKLKIQRTSQAEPQPAHIDMPTVLLHFDNWSSFESPKLVVDWTASIWPAQQESVFAAPIPDLSQCIDQPGMLHNRQHFFAPLGRPGLRFGENARLLLMLGLCHKNPEVHLPAVDIAIAAVAENRFDAESFGMTLRTLFKLDFASRYGWRNNLRRLPGNRYCTRQRCEICWNTHLP
ncbi:MAG: DUF6493 family protein [Planctomycetaceae bacterium]|nr:DUF6493 family protein [Planctomycetaceae bacterium]